MTFKFTLISLKKIVECWKAKLISYRVLMDRRYNCLLKVAMTQVLRNINHSFPIHFLLNFLSFESEFSNFVAYYGYGSHEVTNILLSISNIIMNSHWFLFKRYIFQITLMSLFCTEKLASYSKKYIFLHFTAMKSNTINVWKKPVSCEKRD